jgi:type III pantothenate kinase
MRRYLFLDIGNTNTNWRFQGKFFKLLTQEFEFDKLPTSEKIYVSNVSQRVFDAANDLVTYVESQKSYKSLINAYHEPKSLGSDRWLGMIASYEYAQGMNFIMVDIGSAVTIDAVDMYGSHLGGLIFPGLEKIRQGFNFHTVPTGKNIAGVGESTEKAWTIGTLSLIVNTINQKIKELQIKLPEASVFITGGGYSDLQDFIDFEHDHRENLVLDGLEFYANNVG